MNVVATDRVADRATIAIDTGSSATDTKRSPGSPPVPAGAAARDAAQRPSDHHRAVEQHTEYECGGHEHPGTVGERHDDERNAGHTPRHRASRPGSGAASGSTRTSARRSRRPHRTPSAPANGHRRRHRPVAERERHQHPTSHRRQHQDGGEEQRAHSHGCGMYRTPSAMSETAARAPKLSALPTGSRRWVTGPMAT